jgi:hypothetical protein
VEVIALQTSKAGTHSTILVSKTLDRAAEVPARFQRATEVVRELSVRLELERFAK